MAAESAQPISIHGLGRQLRDMATDPSSELFIYGESVLRPEPHIDNDEPPIFSEVRQKACATTGVAHVIHFPRHLQR